MKLVLTGGGTGGHVFPAINIGLYMREHYGAKLYFIGNKKHIEEKIAKEYGIPFYGISSQGLEGKNVFEKYIGFGFKNSKGTLEARRILQEIKPDYVLGTGGFVSAPTLAASMLLNIPFGIHEQNSVMGKVNKLFEKRAASLFYTFPVTETRTKVHSGIPVRFKEKLPKNGEKLIFTGGSGGSLSLNKFAVHFAKHHPDIPCVVVTGERNYQRTVVHGTPDNLTVYAYAHDMESLYADAKLMVARSGAGTIFELANLGVPSIFVPLPTSADDHQKKNAEFFSKEHAALMIEEKDSFEQTLEDVIQLVWKDPSKQLEMKTNMEKLATRESEKTIAEKILKDLGKRA